MPETPGVRSWYFSDGALELDTLTAQLRAFADRLAAESTGEPPCLVASTASELIEHGARGLSPWASGRETRYLVILDTPVPATMRLPGILGLHKPEPRLHVTPDPLTIRRLVVAQARSGPVGGIVDAYVLGADLVVVLGDLSTRELPIDDLSVLDCVHDVESFRLDVDGSFIEWPEDDLHVDASGLLREVDPAWMAELEIERLRTDRTGEALTEMRKQAGLRQADIEGLSNRHVRRIEKGVSPLSLEAARSFATAFRMELGEFLDRLAGEVARYSAPKGSASL